MADLSGRYALVTGASSGIGRATARALADAGADVFATARSEAGLRETAADHKRIRIYAGDLTEPGFAARLVDAAGSPDILVNNAGRLKHAPFLAGRMEDWRNIFELNVLALLTVTQAVAARMIEGGGGRIILVSSLLARRVAPYTMVYAASKHAVAAIASGLRQELGPKGIGVTEVAPGLVETAVLDAIDDPAVLDSYAVARGRFEWLKPSDIAEAIAYALAARAGTVPDLIELRPIGQV